MSMLSEILEEFWTPRFRYKGVNVNFIGITTFKKFPKRTVQTYIYRLSKQGFVSKKDDSWYITKAGQIHLKNLRKQFTFKNPSSAPKNLLVIFDIPDNRRTDRDWFRKQLGKAGFIMIQQSAWVGPSPLPKEFLVYIKSINLKNCIKTFKLAKGWKI